MTLRLRICCFLACSILMAGCDPAKTETAPVDPTTKSKTPSARTKTAL